MYLQMEKYVLLKMYVMKWKKVVQITIKMSKTNVNGEYI